MVQGFIGLMLLYFFHYQFLAWWAQYYDIGVVRV